MSKILKFTDDELARYDRHLNLADFGFEKQKKLKQAKVLIVGAGGLGCPSALYLAASGVGSITIVDDDKVELSNLQRQVAFSVGEIGQFKATALAQRLRALNSSIEVVDISKRIEANNIEQLIAGCDLIIDGTDNFASRFLIADACYMKRISYLHASVYQYQGQISLFVPGQTACFRCLFLKAPSADALPACGEAGVLGVVTGSVGLMAAVEAIKYLTNLGESIAGKVLTYNTLTQDLKKFNIERDANCSFCSENEKFNTKLEGIQTEADQVNCLSRMEMKEQIIAVARAAELMKNNQVNPQPFLLDVREQKEYDQGHLQNADLWPLSILRAMESAAVGAELRSRLRFTINNRSEDQIIICYCQRGTRSLKAVSILRDAGFNNTFSLEGGLEAWQTDPQKVHQ